ncbi:MAG TPA: phosphoglycerate dehydrogenase [Elusimicrobia bacterium]|nr:MAG: phosphoglycerate dehydrogenase [Elusimicrobia bacterium RIFOXYA12_FULL_49_49]OGS15036.1 MAG: phosphoglycerate dehydrogenase [Elusimicrobia bacterium RIFOXYA2_FULL_47_53]OGS29374.1 MAG: phosphoglycerate dehydrogenase [Elusimicrobia bacterium RIFOXYB2_FULL_46_23]HBU69855.1 phosphoglycerate dehydrogenase [Elusimicrobiota bacterium]
MHKILMTYASTEGLDPILNNPEFKIEVVAKPTPEKFKEIIGEYDGLLIRSEVKVTPEIIEAGKKLKFIGRAGTGVDNVDIPSATQRGIVVANVPGGNTISAAEHTIGLMLAMARNIPQAHGLFKNKEWKREKFMGTELQGKVLGLIGIGRIGREVAYRMIAFGMKVIAYDPFVNADFVKSLGIELKSLDEIYAQADYISIHSPLNDSTRNLINAEVLKKMKKGVRIVNCARGGIIDEKALSEAIKSGHVKGAAIDVFAKEPPVDWTIIETEGVVVTPHLAASTEEAQIKIAQELSEVVVDFYTKGIIRNAVNVPTLDWETYKKLEPYIILAEKIGLFQSQIAEGGIKEVEIEYAGEISKFNTNPINVAYLKGLLSTALDVKVNFVNAPSLAKERGIKIKETRTESSQDYTSLLKAKVFTDKETLKVSATLFGQKTAKIVMVDSLGMDIPPAGNMVYLTNIDRPGIVGQVATILGKNNINIAGMQVGRREQGGEAVTIINVDAAVPQDIVKQIANLSGINKVKYIAL